VLSAMSGTTNELLSISETLPDSKEMEEKIETLKQKYKQEIEGLFQSESEKDHYRIWVEVEFEELAKVANSDHPNRANIIVGKGEQWSTQLFVAQGLEKGFNYKFYRSPAFIATKKGEDETLDWTAIDKSFAAFVAQRSPGEISVFQGFICSNSEGEIANLGRGGSDYSAAIIGKAIGAEEVQIWTDVDGFCANDPRVVPNPKVLESLSFEEAAELAYFGAKILHPATILPCRDSGIPVRLKNTLKPEAPGTLIDRNATHEGIRAVAAKDGISVIRITSTRMLLAHGFLQKIFEIFSRHKTSIDMVATSEVSVSLTIDNDSKLADILQEMEQYGRVEIEPNQTIVSVVGKFGANTHGFAAIITQKLVGIPLGMISYGGSRTNISFVIPEEDKKRALTSLNELVANKNLESDVLV
jgi:aspartate kinase